LIEKQLKQILKQFFRLLKLLFLKSVFINYIFILNNSTILMLYVYWLLMMKKSTTKTINHFYKDNFNFFYDWALKPSNDLIGFIISYGFFKVTYTFKSSKKKKDQTFYFPFPKIRNKNEFKFVWFRNFSVLFKQIYIYNKKYIRAQY
jgi:hypothetical protein